MKERRISSLRMRGEVESAVADRGMGRLRTSLLRMRPLRMRPLTLAPLALRLIGARPSPCPRGEEEVSP